MISWWIASPRWCPFFLPAQRLANWSSLAISGFVSWWIAHRWLQYSGCPILVDVIETNTALVALSQLNPMEICALNLHNSESLNWLIMNWVSLFMAGEHTTSVDHVYIADSLVVQEILANLLLPTHKLSQVWPLLIFKMEAMMSGGYYSPWLSLTGLGQGAEKQERWKSLLDMGQT